MKISCIKQVIMNIQQPYQLTELFSQEVQQGPPFMGPVLQQEETVKNSGTFHRRVKHEQFSILAERIEF